MKRKQYIDVNMVTAIMKLRGMNAKTLAQKIGISENEVVEFIGGADQEQMSIERMYEYANALGVPVMMIIHRDYH